MKHVRQWIVTATLVASTAFTSMALGASVTDSQKVSVIGGTATLPQSVKMVTLSKSAMVPYLMNDFEEYVQAEKSKNSPSKKPVMNMSTDAARVYGDQLATYKATENLLTWIDSFRLGERSDIYQWQMKDQDGRKMAQVVAIKFRNLYSLVPGMPLQMGDANIKVDEGAVDAGLFMLNMRFNELRNEGKPIFIKTGTLGDSTAEPMLDYTVQVDNLMAIQKLNATKHPTYMTSAKVLYNVGGMEQVYHVQPALVLTKEEPILYVMITSDIEKSTFIPIFTNFVTSLK
ncbi:hypothetical protein [uncultured Veillonella sp.]|uniref:hypothetical protein n=1 Tax=uncultured Veillonella sp. TaxID=159268 RepID=UPI00262CD4BC|nr:hypothetical protein [uncultured Veillonella sp.]